MPLLRNAALLRDFLAVAGTGGVSAAAQTLGVSQPALTKSIRRLEAHYGLALFERRARGMALTPFGETLLAHAKLIDAQCRFADAEMRAFTKGAAGRLRIGAGPFWGATVIPLAIVRLQQQLPNLEVELDVGVNTIIHPKLFAGDLDIVVCALPDAGVPPPGIDVHRFFDLTMRVIAGDDHPLVRRRPRAVSVGALSARSRNGRQADDGAARRRRRAAARDDRVELGARGARNP